MFLSVSIINHSLLFSIYFIALTQSQSNTIGKACGVSDSTCGAGQTCIGGRCECDPNKRGFWTGEKLQCRVCPPSYSRLPTRCYKFYSTSKIQSEARAECRRDQADLFSWRDNSDESILIDASTAYWNSAFKRVYGQIYTWSGGMINHGRGTKADYKVTWYDPKAPTIPHPEFKNQYTERYCNALLIANYRGDAEPTRRTKMNETENCVTHVFVPQALSQGQVCIADDYCSIKLSFICELTEATIEGIYQTAAPPVLPTDANGIQEPLQPFQPMTGADSGALDALGAKDGKNNSTTLIYLVGLLTVFVVFGIVAFVIIRKRKQKAEAMDVSQRPSVANSNMSDASGYSNA